MSDESDPFLVRFAVPMPRESATPPDAEDDKAKAPLVSDRADQARSIDRAVTRATHVRRETTDES